MNVVISNRLVNLLKEHGCKIRTDYSGRHMYGVKCFSIEFKINLINYIENELTKICEVITQETMNEINLNSDNKELKDKLENDINTLDYIMNIDSTQFYNHGLKYVLYYPNIKAEK